MKECVYSRLLIAVLLFSLGACTVVKSPSSTANFKRVKYNSNLRLAKSQNEKVEVLSTASQAVQSESFVNEISTRQVKLSPRPYLKLKLDELPILNPKKASMKSLGSQSNYSSKQLISQAKEHELSLKPEQLFTNKWWEDDPEDWPWKKIIIFTILFFLVALITYLIVDLVGGVVGGIAGVILLLVLIYFMIDYLGS